MSTNSASRNALTGHLPHHTHPLLPAIKPDIPFAKMTQQPGYSFLAWTFGRGTVIWKIWPAVMLHTAFAAFIVYLKENRGMYVGIPNVMLTVLGVVIGFVISYRAMSGYDRYWMGRTAWSDVIRNSRTIGRLVWFHVPPRMTPKTQEEIETGLMSRSNAEMMKVMAEKRMALDLVEGFAVAVKHHLRGEVGIYYEDLYNLVRPLHDHDHTPSQKTAAMSSALPPPSRARRIASNPSLPVPRKSPNSSGSTPIPRADSQSKSQQKVHYNYYADAPPLPPPQNTVTPSAYGTFQRSESPRGSSNRHSLRRTPSSTSQISSNESVRSEHRVLKPSQNPGAGEGDVLREVSMDLIPFAGVFRGVRGWVRERFGSGRARREGDTEVEAGVGVGVGGRGGEGGRDRVTKDPYGYDASQRKWSGPVQPRVGSKKHTIRRKMVEDEEGEEGGMIGENLPVEVLRCLSEWCSVLEDRNTVPGTSLGGIIGCIAAMEATLVDLERILTTPLPFVYSVHIRHTVWVYLFFLPFQLVAEFSWHTVPGVTIAAFIYLGFLAAGEEIEQPFGYDENDLDLDMFCQEIIHVDIENLKKSPCLNAYLPPGPRTQRLVRHRSMTLIEATQEGLEDSSDGEYRD